MAGTNTPNLQLYKPDPGDTVNVETDLNGNWDTVDSKGEVLLRREARFEKPSGVTQPNNGHNDISFPDQEFNDGSIVTPDGSFIQFTLNKTGIWVITGKLRFSGGSASGAARQLFRLVSPDLSITYADDQQAVAGDKDLRFYSGPLLLIAGTVVKASGNTQTTGTVTVGGGSTSYLGFEWRKA